MQIALLGIITPNLRVVQVTYDEKSINLFFHYEKKPSQEEIEISDEVVTKLTSIFHDIASTNINRIVLPALERIPDFGLRVFHRREWKYEDI